MFDVLLSLAVSFTIAFLAIPAIITVADTKKLFDLPDERKIHQAHIPSLGGVGIFAAFILACLISIRLNQFSEFQYFFASALVMFFLGLKDDILVISPIKKFVGQVIAAFLIIYKGHIQITSMNGFLGISQLPEMFSLLLTYFTVLVVINSFNLIDGVDGLAGTLGLVSGTVFGLYFLRAGETEYAVFAFSLVGSLVAFLIFNFHPAKIFMGDTGSMLIGLVNAILVVKFINVSSEPAANVPVEAAAALGFIILLIPLLDTLRVFSIRMFNRRSPFSPDRNHIHHLMLDKGWSHRTVTLTLSAASIVFTVAAYLLRKSGCTVLIAGGVTVFFSGIAALYYTRQPRLFVARRIPRDRDDATIVPLTEDTILEQKN